MNQSADTCLAAVFHGPGRELELRSLPLPEPAAGEALVRVTCCTLCGSDLHTITGARQEPTPSILGHEIIGEVTDVGDPPPRDLDERPLQPGDRVTWSVCVSCGTCDRCQRGLPQKCRTLAKYGHERFEGRGALSGGLAEYVLLRPGTAVVRIDGAIPDEVICPANCATATIAAAWRSAGQIRDRRVLIFGAGMLGLTATAFAMSNAAAQVVVCDPGVDRLSRAAKFGADATVEWSDSGDELRERLLQASGAAEFDVILELSGAPAAVEAACRCADVGAHVALVGTVMTSRPVQLDPERIVRQCLVVTGVHNYAPQDLKMAVDFLQLFEPGFPFGELAEQKFRLSDVNEAIACAIRDRPVRVAVCP